MTEPRKEFGDSDVSARYREIADDGAPASLDRKILDAAEKALRSNGGWRDAWYRPLTLAATVGLAFAFVLELGDLPGDAGPPDELGAPRALAPDAFQDAGRANEERFQELQMESQRSMQSAPDSMFPPTDAGSAPATTVDGNQQPASPRCTADERRNPTTWWDCIRELEKSGFRQAAEVELQSLLEAFPAFDLPE
jgi:hypothetical protein